MPCFKSDTVEECPTLEMKSAVNLSKMDGCSVYGAGVVNPGERTDRGKKLKYIKNIKYIKN